MNYTPYSYCFKFLMIAISIICIPISSRADLRQETNIRDMQQQSDRQCEERIERETLFRGNTQLGDIRIVGKEIYELEKDFYYACKHRWIRKSVIGVEKVYEYQGQTVREVYHIERKPGGGSGSELCWYRNKPGYGKQIFINCVDLQTGTDSRRKMM